MKLEGVLVASTTPFAADGSLALDKLRENIARYNTTRLAGYVVVGSTGESVLLSADEVDRVLAAARDAAAPEKILLAGTGVETTAETIARSRRAADLGYDAVLVKTPHYFKALLTPAALERHYRTVADASTIPLVIYSIPQYTGVPLTAEWVARLAEHPNIVGIKESSGNVQLAAEIVHACPSDFRVMVGSAAALLPSLSVGADGGILGLACFLPEISVDLYQAARASDLPLATRIQQSILPASRKIVAECGPAGVKYAMDRAGYFGGEPRLPLLPLSDAQKVSIRSALEQAGPAAAVA